MSRLRSLGSLLQCVSFYRPCPITVVETYHFPSIQVEMGSKNHEVVPSTLIATVSGLRNGGVNKILGILAKRNLVAKVQNSKCMYQGTVGALKLTFG
jgi:RIO-like serine/threonine protein kinase